MSKYMCIIISRPVSFAVLAQTETSEYNKNQNGFERYERYIPKVPLRVPQMNVRSALARSSGKLERACVFWRQEARTIRLMNEVLDGYL